MKKSPNPLLAVVLGAIALAAIPAGAQVCGPLDDGRLADVYYDGTTIFWDSLVDFEKVVLTITGPCEDIVRTFGPNDPIVFDIREVERIVDGQYTWTLQRTPKIDEGVRRDLEEARGSGKEDAIWWSYFQAGQIPDGPFNEAGAFSVVSGEVIDPASGSEKSALVEKAIGSDGLITPSAFPEKAVVLTNADGVIRNSLCVGFDCPNNPAFDDSTIILQENNTRLKFSDTSVSTFPSGDWEIEANSSASGGLSYLAFNDCGSNDLDGGCATDLVFGVEAGARQHALWVESDGDVGVGTQNPTLDVHVVTSNTPALRLEQDATGGFTAQTWDIAGNEANFFVRDVTGGSRLPFRIRPGAPTSAIDISNDGDVGIGTASPTASLHVQRTDTAQILVANTTATSATRILQHLRNEGTTVLRFENTAAPALGDVWDYQVANGGAFQISAEGSGAVEFLLTPSGDLTITGNLVTGGGGLCDPGPCDGTFSPEYEVESIEEHAEYMWKNRHLWGVGPTPEGAPINLSKKTTGILHELEKAHIYIEQLHGTIQELAKRVDQLENE